MSYGIEILFFALGALSVLGIQLLMALNLKYGFEWKTMALGCVSVFLGGFTLAWSASSLIEGENQAAGLGLILFGLPALMSGLMARKFLQKPGDLKKACAQRPDSENPI